jgi:CRP-like cAMP-binding protein
MDHGLLLSNIARHISLSREEEDHFISLIQYKRIQRKDHLLQEGQSCKTINYVHSGAMRAFHIDKKGKEATIMFAVADWWITDMNCFINAQPAMMYIQAIEDTEVFQLSKENFDLLFQQIPKFEKFFRILMQNAYVREQLRVLQNLSLDAEERYNNFITKYPQIVQRVTQKQIASYLGVTPEFLSVVRKNKAAGIIS